METKRSFGETRFCVLRAAVLDSFNMMEAGLDDGYD